MLPFSAFVPGKTHSSRVRCSLVIAAVSGLLLHASPRLGAQESAARPATPSRLVSPIDEHSLVTLPGNVRKDLAAAEDLGAVEDGKPFHLYLLLKRTTSQQADLDNLIARQQEPTAAEYHKWMTPKEFGARFGANPDDIAKLSTWLQSHGFQVRSVLNNASVIDFAATAGQVREAFHTELHYFNIEGGKYAANVQDPQIPAALAPVVAGVMGLVKIPLHTAHTTPRPATYDKATHRWTEVNPTRADGLMPAEDQSDGAKNVTPQDLYTIYNINPIFNGGDLAATATVAVIEQADIVYGTVNATTNVAAGGDVATFRSEFGVPGTLNMHVYHGYGTVTCSDPGLASSGDVSEASLDAEWINATAPSANLVYMSCDQSPDQGVATSMMALIDNNVSDVMSMSYSATELSYTSGEYSFWESLEAQAATQGQTIFISAGDAGADLQDQNATGTATSGINVSGNSSDLVTVAGGTDFSDTYDANEGGAPISTYWSATNPQYYGTALSYIPETVWNQSCASSITEVYYGETGTGLCVKNGSANDGHVVGGGGGISTHYLVPAWQSGISGYSNAYRSSPDLSGFASGGYWNHSLASCDSHSNDPCWELSGGTSFVSPYLAGVAGLLVTYTGSRQGFLNPALYALAKAQYTNPATATACYANGQTANAGVTTGLSAADCIFNDVTTSNNDVPCAAGSTDCYVSSGTAYGILSLNGATSLEVAYPAAPGFDSATGLGSVNVNNLITKWNTAFGSTTALSASLTSLTSSQSTSLTATVTGKTPTGYVDTPPKLTGTASFKAGTTALGNCTLSAGTCKLTVAGSALQSGANSVTATFSGSKTYPASTSSIVTVTVTETGAPAVTLSATSLSFGSIKPGATSASQSVTLTNTGTGPLTITSIAVTGADASSFVFANSCGTSVAAGANCAIHGHFTPATTGALTAAVTITDNASGSPQSIALSGTGLTPPAVSLSANSLTFAGERVGVTSASQSVTLTNTGTGPLAITSIAVTGTDASSFGFANSCGTTVAAGANCTIHGHFTPAATGALTAAVTITDNASGSPQSITLSGTGLTPPAVSLSANSLTFAGEPVGVTSASQSVTLTNTGTGPLAITSIAVTGADASSFVFANSCGTSVAGGASCTIHGHFTPAATGALTAAVTITDNASGSPQSIALSGTGN